MFEPNRKPFEFGGIDPQNCEWQSRGKLYPRDWLTRAPQIAISLYSFWRTVIYFNLLYCSWPVDPSVPSHWPLLLLNMDSHLRLLMDLPVRIMQPKIAWSSAPPPSRMDLWSIFMLLLILEWNTKFYISQYPQMCGKWAKNGCILS